MASAYYTPGVYIEEVDKGPKPIQGVGTSVTAFVGFTAKAEQLNEDGFTTSSLLSKAKLITNWTQYEKNFGGLHENAYLPYAVRGFFDNGGITAWVISVHAHSTHAAQALITAQPTNGRPAAPCLLVHAKECGPTGDKIKVEIKSQTSGANAPSEPQSISRTSPPPRRRGPETESTTPADGSATASVGGDSGTPPPTEPPSTPAPAASGNNGSDNRRFTLSVLVDDKEVESIKDLLVDDLPNLAQRDAETEDVHKSKYVKVWSLMNNKSTKPAERFPQLGFAQLEGGAPKIDMELLDEADKKSLLSANGAKVDENDMFSRNAVRLFNGSAAKRKGIDGLQAIDNVNLLCAPDVALAHQMGQIDDEAFRGIQKAMLDFCRLTQYRFAILDAPFNRQNPEDILNWRMNEAGYDSMHGALYYPWLKISDPLSGRSKFIPPSGHIAGIYSRSDSQRGVHKAPANEDISGVIDVKINVTRGEQDLLNPVGINCIRKFAGRGVRVWGARTLSSDPAWRYINVRRLFNFVEESVERSMQWTVFEPNDVYLWGKVNRDISAFLRVVWRSGALFGVDPNQAFYVKCDEELNPQEVRDQGLMICEIGMAPVKPAEFVIFRFSQYALPSA